MVSRWFIECEGGKSVVNHLVMCGTPNNGSPFGLIGDARKVFTCLAKLAMNSMLVPYGKEALGLLNYSEKLTVALEQTGPKSAFLQSLNQSQDPGVPYTILAGDVSKYVEGTDKFFPRLLSKIGQSSAYDLLFAEKANDIAVGVESVLWLGTARIASRRPKGSKSTAIIELFQFSGGWRCPQKRELVQIT